MKYLMILILVMFAMSCTGSKNEMDYDLIDSDENNDSDIEQDIENDDSDIEPDCEESDGEIWDKVLENVDIWKIEKLSDGDYLILGVIEEFWDPEIVQFSYVAKLAPDFSIKWFLHFDELNNGYNVNSFNISGDGTIYFAGTLNSNRFFLMSASIDGKIIYKKDWKYEKEFNTELGSNFLTDIEIDNSGVYVSGFTAGYFEDGTTASYTRLYTAKTDFEGNLLWEKMWGSAGGDTIQNSTQDSEGNIYMTGYTVGNLDGNKNAGTPGDCSNIPWGPEGSSCPDSFLIKMNKDGEVLWTRQFGSPAQSIMDFGFDVVVDNSDFVYVLSQSTFYGAVESVIRKYDKEGKLIWDYIYNDNGRYSFEQSGKMFIDSNERIIIAGVAKERTTFAKTLHEEGFVIALDKETAELIGEKRLSVKNNVGFSVIFENELGLNVTGYKIYGQYEPYPEDIRDKYQYGIKNIGYFYLDPKLDSAVTKGTKFDRETVEVGSLKDDEAVFSHIDSEGNLYVAGNSWGSLDKVKNKGKKDVFVAKYKADMTLDWIKYYGSTDWDDLSAGFADIDGNIILTGTTWGDFEGNQRFGVGDIFVMKIDKTGKTLWTAIAGSDNDDWANGLWVDNSGNIFVTGGTLGSIDENEFSGGFGSDMFVGKWDKNGNKILIEQWGKRIEGFGLIGDGSGNVYLAGRTESNYADLAVYEQGVPDSIIFKLDDKSLMEQWARIWGSEEIDSATGIAVDSAGDIFVTGYTFGPIDGNIHLGADCPGGFCPDAYLTKWDSTGKKKWTRQFGTENGDRATSIVIDEKDSIYISGTAGKNRLCEIESDIFLMKSDTSGNLDEIKIWGTAGEESVNSINISNGKIIISGFTTGGLDNSKNKGGKDGFVTVIEK